MSKVLSGADFTFGVDDDGAAFALCLCLLGNGADHAVWQVDVFELNAGHLHAPAFGVFVDELFNTIGNLLAL